ncbi:MAG: hypothetical protein AKCLJLPJ_01709 [Fimbriimonadales bacterium]|nr:hypothetical protein [Fimbriimonadales bacterium]
MRRRALTLLPIAALVVAVGFALRPTAQTGGADAGSSMASPGIAEGGEGHEGHGHQEPDLGTAPVTRRELREVMLRFHRDIRRAFELEGEGGELSLPEASNEPATRAEFVLALSQIVEELRPNFIRDMPNKIVNTRKFAVSDGKVRSAMTMLAQEGFLHYWSPIFHGPANTMTPRMLGVALSQAAPQIGAHFREKDDSGEGQILQGMGQ